MIILDNPTPETIREHAREGHAFIVRGKKKVMIDRALRTSTAPSPPPLTRHVGKTGDVYVCAVTR
jgi:hypothetical protein